MVGASNRRTAAWLHPQPAPEQAWLPRPTAPSCWSPPGSVRALPGAGRCGRSRCGALRPGRRGPASTGSAPDLVATVAPRAAVPADGRQGLRRRAADPVGQAQRRPEEADAETVRRGRRPAEPADRRVSLDVARIDTGRLVAVPARPLRRRGSAGERLALGARRHRRARSASTPDGDARAAAPTPTSSRQVVTQPESRTPVGTARAGCRLTAAPIGPDADPRRAAAAPSTTRAGRIDPGASAGGCSPSSGSTVRGGGSGLGMYIVHGLVHGARAVVELATIACIAGPRPRAPGVSTPARPSLAAGPDATGSRPASPQVPRLMARVPAAGQRCPGSARPCRDRTSEYDPVEVTPLKAGGDRRGARGRPARRSPPPPTSTPSSGCAGRARGRPLAARRWPTERSVRCRRRPARTPASAWARPAAQVNRAARRSVRPCWRSSTRRGCWSRRPSTSRCRWDRSPRGARHPLTTLQERIVRRVRRHGLGGRRGPRARGASG